ncbi:unnamed protein product [Hymenolepis diminuta]|uniref:Secreted protein n=1 Tax=Hymenolepis diminuta TaxID=6216 RepID=A0A0R3SQ05_HYMDI|nr:unnamed protein product [Hymenolepis diminuta]
MHFFFKKLVSTLLNPAADPNHIFHLKPRRSAHSTIVLDNGFTPNRLAEPECQSKRLKPIIYRGIFSIYLPIKLKRHPDSRRDKL